MKPGEACVTRGHGFNSHWVQSLAWGVRHWLCSTLCGDLCWQLGMCPSPRLHILLMYWVNHLLDILAPGCPKGDWPNTLTLLDILAPGCPKSDWPNTLTFLNLFRLYSYCSEKISCTSWDALPWELITSICWYVCCLEKFNLITCDLPHSKRNNCSINRSQKVPESSKCVSSVRYEVSSKF